MSIRIARSPLAATFEIQVGPIWSHVGRFRPLSGQMASRGWIWAWEGGPPSAILNIPHLIRSGEVHAERNVGRSAARPFHILLHPSRNIKSRPEPLRTAQSRPKPPKAFQSQPKPSRSFQRRPAEDWGAGPNPKGPNIPNVLPTRTVTIFNRKRLHSSIFPANYRGGHMRGRLG